MSNSVQILLAEDEPVLRHLVARILNKAGYSVVSCENGAQALAAAEHEPCKFQLVVTDLVMPGVNGYDLASKVKQSCPRTKVLMMTGYAPDSMSRPADLHEVPLLNKPFTQADLLGAVERLLNPAPHS